MCAVVLPQSLCNLDWIMLIHFCIAFGVQHQQASTTPGLLTKTCLHNPQLPGSEHVRHTHLLPANDRINFKIVIITYNLLAINQRSYIGSLISVYQPSRSLRSADRQQLTVARCATVLGNSAFLFGFVTYSVERYHRIY